MTGKNKEMNYTETKGIRLTKEQAENWNPKEIRKFLDTGKTDQRVLENVVKKFIPALKKYRPNIDFNENEFSIIKNLMEEL